MDLERRKAWNEKHKLLTEIILKPDEHSRAVQLFLSQHALLHSSEVGDVGKPTLEDEVLNDLDDITFRKYPVATPDTENSVAWHLWHIARIEDMTMSILVADDQQVLSSENWLEKMNVRFLHSGNDMSQVDIAELSSSINLDSLLAYRVAVGRHTRQIISSLKPGQFKSKVEQKRIKRLDEEHAVTLKAKWLTDYWSKKTIAGLVLMPATRHLFLHLNKCVRIKDKIHKQMKNPLQS
ncbi:MAG: DinB family protein [Bacillota bacterium]